MKNTCFVLITFFSFLSSIHAQSFLSNTPEFQVSYFGELFVHPGAKIGIHFPFYEKNKLKYRNRKRKGDFTLTKNRKLKLGSNLAFYRQGKNHKGYLSNIELTFHNTRNRSYKPDKYRHFEASVGMGYFRYALSGTTFTPDGDSFKDIKGNGNALMPSISIGTGKSLKFIKSIDVRYFVKGSNYFEIPHGLGKLKHFALEIGFASTLTSKISKI